MSSQQHRMIQAFTLVHNEMIQAVPPEHILEETWESLGDFDSVDQETFQKRKNASVWDVTIKPSATPNNSNLFRPLYDLWHHMQETCQNLESFTMRIPSSHTSPKDLLDFLANVITKIPNLKFFVYDEKSGVLGCDVSMLSHTIDTATIETKTATGRDVQTLIRVGNAVMNGKLIPTRNFLYGNAAKCLKCEEIIVSKDQHEFVWCRCQSIFVDGGDQYYRYGGNMAKFDASFESDLMFWMKKNNVELR